MSASASERSRGGVEETMVEVGWAGRLVGALGLCICILYVVAGEGRRQG